MKVEAIARLMIAVVLVGSTVTNIAEAQTFRTRWSAEDAKARVSELEQLGETVVENDYLVADELRSLGEEIKNARASSRGFEPQLQALSNVESVKTGFLAFLNKLGKVDCAQEEQRKEIGKDADEANEAISEISTPLPGAYAWDSESTSFSTEQECNETKAKPFGETYETLKSQLDTMVVQATERQKAITENSDSAKRLLTSLEKRREALLRKLQSPQQLLTQNLVGLIMTIAGAGVASMLALLAFRADIQREWVISGQVIQFVTVLILLSVSLALGLAGILKEQSLGTLLGGLAGYVLAQGVGQAARQGARRGTEGPVTEDPNGAPKK